MKIGVCTKSTPDTETRIKIRADGEGIDAAGIKWIIGPYDQIALERAVTIKEKLGGEVVLFTVGGEDAKKNLYDGLAVGGDRAVQIADPALAAADSLGIARVLAAAVKAEGSEVLFCGKQAIDDDNVQVPAMIAEILGWPHVSFVNTFETDGKTFKASRAVGGGVEEVVEGNLPVVLTADRSLAVPRYAKLPDIMKAKKKPVATKNLAALGLSAADAAPAVKVSKFALPPARAKGRIIPGETPVAVKELVRLLREEAKVL